MFIYRLLQAFLRVVSRIFFRQIEVVGLENVPTEGRGPVIFAGNHPNSLIDPVLIIAFSGRIVHFAAKDVLFQSWLLRVVLRGLGAVPIARRADHGDGAVQNDGAFAALNDVLRSGRAMGIFPEGLSHDASQIAQLKTGAARIAFSAAGEGVPLQIIPVGITYVRRRRFRSRVLLQFGEPIAVEAREPTKDAVRGLTTTIEGGLRALTVNAEDWDTLRVLDGVRRLYQPAGIAVRDRIELARRFSTHYAALKDQPEIRTLYAQVHGYLERLDEAGLSDADLQRGAELHGAVPRLLRHLALALIWLPLAIPGFIVHAPVGLLAIFAGRVLTPRKDVIATSKLVAGILGAIAMYVGLVAFTGLGYGPLPALGMALFLPLTGLATLRVFDRATSIRRWGRTLVRLSRLDDDVKDLRAERDGLEAAVVRTVERFKPEDLVALFPRSSATP